MVATIAAVWRQFVGIGSERALKSTSEIRYNLMEIAPTGVALETAFTPDEMRRAEACAVAAERFH